MVDMDIRVSSHLKEELAWAEDKRLWVINIIKLFKNNCSIKELQCKRNQRIFIYLFIYVFINSDTVQNLT